MPRAVGFWCSSIACLFSFFFPFCFPFFLLPFFFSLLLSPFFFLPFFLFLISFLFTFSFSIFCPCFSLTFFSFLVAWVPSPSGHADTVMSTRISPYTTDLVLYMCSPQPLRSGQDASCNQSTCTSGILPGVRMIKAENVQCLGTYLGLHQPGKSVPGPSASSNQLDGSLFPF